MSFTKTQIYNLALSSLLLTRQVSNIETDRSTEVAVLNQFYDIALESTLEDLDLDSTSQSIPLELLAQLTEGQWAYVYKYPLNCAFLRRIESCVRTDNRSTHISKRIGTYESQKAIYTNEYQAVGECIPKDIMIESLGSSTIMAIAYKLASLSSPLITGKGAKTLIDRIEQQYVIAKMEAQRKDAGENFNYEEDEVRSEFVQERLS